MAQSLSKIIIHIIFSTKGREKNIPHSLENELHDYIAGICYNLKCPAIRVGGTSDHLHIAVHLDRSISISKLVGGIKANSSRWIKTKNPLLRNFSWQSGYGVFSIGQSQIDDLIHYIENQREHHTILTFMEEYLAFLKKYRIEFDNEKIWE